MNALRIAACLAAALPCSISFATTDCPGSVSVMTAERTADGSLLRVNFRSGASFVVDGKDDAWSRQVTELAGLSSASGQTVTARFAESGLRCDDVHGRSDLVSITIRSEATTMATTTPPPARPDTATPTLAERR